MGITEYNLIAHSQYTLKPSPCSLRIIAFTEARCPLWWEPRSPLKWSIWCRTQVSNSQPHLASHTSEPHGKPLWSYSQASRWLYPGNTFISTSLRVLSQNHHVISKFLTMILYKKVNVYYYFKPLTFRVAF